MPERSTLFGPDPFPPGDSRFIREWRPDRGTARGAFLLLHGMESHSGWFDPLAVRLAADGWVVLAPDLPGWGRSAGPRGHLRSYRDFLEETSAIASSARERYGSVHLVGMSWGGLAALYIAMRRSWLFDTLGLLAPGLAARRDIGSSGRLRAVAAILFGRPDAEVSAVFRPGDFTAHRQFREYIETDPARVRRVDASFCFETFKMRRFVRENAGRRRLPPSLCLLAGEDAIIDNPATEAICRQAGIATEVLPGAAHSLVFERPEESAAALSRLAAGTKTAPVPNRPVWIVGVGAVGGALASLLSFGGVTVGLLARSGRIAALRENGILLRSGNGRRRTGRNSVPADNLAGLPSDPALALLAVKNYDLEDAIPALAKNLPPDAVVASIQNGVGSEVRLARAFPGRPLVAAAVSTGLETNVPGIVDWPDDRGGIAAAASGENPGQAREAWLAAMAATGMECRWFDFPRAAERLKWSKLILNAGFNALNALTDLSSADILRCPETGQLAIQAMREGFAIMRALSLAPVDLPGYPVARLAFFLRAPASLARAVLSRHPAPEREAAFSMRQDRMKRRSRSEIAELNGAIVRAGRELGIDTPANRELTARIEAVFSHLEKP
ncbi:MAG: 2-dehydropantoate 2-reductase [Planctomycetota bacterium]|jgi:2-dehydropantoate 2-reductase|nr:2-dehydropantoate 2-reductase [Planctomycetota bacterium]